MFANEVDVPLLAALKPADCAALGQTCRALRGVLRAKLATTHHLTICVRDSANDARNKGNILAYQLQHMPNLKCVKMTLEKGSHARGSGSMLVPLLAQLGDVPQLKVLAVSFPCEDCIFHALSAFIPPSITHLILQYPDTHPNSGPAAHVDLRRCTRHATSSLKHLRIAQPEVELSVSPDHVLDTTWFGGGAKCNTPVQSRTMFYGKGFMGGFVGRNRSVATADEVQVEAHALYYKDFCQLVGGMNHMTIMFDELADDSSDSDDGSDDDSDGDLRPLVGLQELRLHYAAAGPRPDVKAPSGCTVIWDEEQPPVLPALAFWEQLCAEFELDNFIH